MLYLLSGQVASIRKDVVTGITISFILRRNAIGNLRAEDAVYVIQTCCLYQFSCCLLSIDANVETIVHEDSLSCAKFASQGK